MTIATMAVLSKIPAGIYFITFLPLILDRNIQFSVKTKFAVASIVPVLATYYWYFIWNPYLSITYGNWYNSGKSLSEGLSDLTENIPSVLQSFYFDSFHSYVLFSAFIVGLLIAILKKAKPVLIVFTLVSVVFAFYMLKSGHYFYHHNYYIIPFVPVMAIVAGFGIAQIKTKWIFILALTAGSIEAIANQQHEFFLKDSEMNKMDLEGILDLYTDRSDLIAINGNGNPQLIYLAHRKGWNYSNDQLKNPEFIEQIKSQGCSHIVIANHQTVDLRSIPNNLVYSDDQFIIISIID